MTREQKQNLENDINNLYRVMKDHPFQDERVRQIKDQLAGIDIALNYIGYVFYYSQKHGKHVVMTRKQFEKLTGIG